MKNYNEMSNDVLRRIGEHETEQRNRRKTMKWIITPVCSICLVALLGIGLWQGDFFGTAPPITLDDSTVIGDKDYIDPTDLDDPQKEQTSSANNNTSSEINSQPNVIVDVIGMVKVNGINYVQCSTNTKVYTPDEYLGNAYDFEGTYQTYFSDSTAGLYIAKEDPNVLMVELKQGEYVNYVILMREK